MMRLLATTGRLLFLSVVALTGSCIWNASPTASSAPTPAVVPEPEPAPPPLVPAPGPDYAQRSADLERQVAALEQKTADLERQVVNLELRLLEKEAQAEELETRLEEARRGGRIRRAASHKTASRSGREKRWPSAP